MHRKLFQSFDHFFMLGAQFDLLWALCMPGLPQHGNASTVDLLDAQEVPAQIRFLCLLGQIACQIIKNILECWQGIVPGQADAGNILSVLELIPLCQSGVVLHALVCGIRFVVRWPGVNCSDQIINIFVDLAR